ncbi:MAG TPA: hypothetical protein VNJ08_07075 [Bacteriovoracaceae bacterium]|nr:hypothetical protein [Bacteriovoracaceae bacterium]
MKFSLLLALPMCFLSSFSYAQMTDDDLCIRNADGKCIDEESEIREPQKEIYPYKPFSTELIRQRMERLMEGHEYISNIHHMDEKNLTRANTKVQPWGGSFWPVYQGGIANRYQRKDNVFYIFTPLKNTMYQANVKEYKNKSQKDHLKIYDLDEKALAKLSPAEKYDLLLGDATFSLTNRVWDFVEKRGENRDYEYLTYLELPDGYKRLEPKNFLAFWEGICHGWALGSGFTPRPEKTVNFTLPNGKVLPFFPNDIKALASQMWANSDVQNYSINEGGRCNVRNPHKDKYGRYIDTEIDPQDHGVLKPNCGDVHPAIFHTFIVNYVGVEGRSFVYDHNPKAPIANQPVSGYEFTYFNAMTGKEGNLKASMVSRESFKDDPFAISRNPETTHIVGIQMNAKYVNWEKAIKKVVNSASDDKIIDNEFKYDLELNAQGEIIGGQWRVSQKSKKPGVFAKSPNQPDYFWIVPRNWKSYFEEDKTVPAWEGNGLPPVEYKTAALAGHYFLQNSDSKLGGVNKCLVVAIDGEGPAKRVDCAFNVSRPRPLINVVNKLIELSRK